MLKTTHQSPLTAFFLATLARTIYHFITHLKSRKDIKQMPTGATQLCKFTSPLPKSCSYFLSCFPFKGQCLLQKSMPFNLPSFHGQNGKKAFNLPSFHLIKKVEQIRVKRVTIRLPQHQVCMCPNYTCGGFFNRFFKLKDPSYCSCWLVDKNRNWNFGLKTETETETVLFFNITVWCHIWMMKM